MIVKKEIISFDEWLNCDRKGGSFYKNIKIFIEQNNIDEIINLLSEGYKQGYDNGCFEVLLGLSHAQDVSEKLQSTIDGLKSTKYLENN